MILYEILNEIDAGYSWRKVIQVINGLMYV